MSKYYVKNESYVKINPVPKYLSKEDKIEIDKQNKIILEGLKKINLKPYAISRDKNNHILIFTLEKARDKGYSKQIICHMIGLDIKSKIMGLYQVGNLQYSDQVFHDEYFNASEPSYGENSIYICRLSVHKSFQGLNIGKLLLQVAENIAVENNKKYLTLEALVDIKINNEARALYGKFGHLVSKLTRPNLNYIDYNELIDRDDFVEYIQDNCFDKNYYFYSTYGFQEYLPKDRHKLTRPLAKPNLKKVVLDYGLEKPLVQVDKNDPKFSLRTYAEQYKKDSYEVLCSVNDCLTNNLFFAGVNTITPSQFSPVEVFTTNKGTKWIKDIFNYVDLTSFEENNIFHLTFNLIDESQRAQNEKFSMYAKSKRFKEILQSYEKPLDQAKPTQPGEE